MVRAFMRGTREAVGPPEHAPNMAGCGVVVGLLIAVPVWIILWLIAAMVWGS